MSADSLTQRERDFCRIFVANGGNGAAAAAKAGFSAHTAKVKASQLLKIPKVIREIERLRASIDRSARAIMGAITVRGATADAIDGEVIPPDVVDGVHAALIDRLTRNYIVANLMEIVEIGMGKRPTMMTRIIKETKSVDGAMREELTAVQIAQSERDLAAANGALAQLTKHLEWKEERADRSDGALDVTPADERAQQWEELLKPFKALAGNFTPKANGHANGHGNGHANGHTNGHGG